MSDFWRQLEKHRSQTAETSISSLFKDTTRFSSYSAETDGMLLDFSKTSLDADAMDLLVQLAQSKDLEAKIAAMFRGDAINTTEGRAVLHTALRTQADSPILVDGENVLPEIRAIRRQMEAFAEGVRSGKIPERKGAQAFGTVRSGLFPGLLQLRRWR